MTLPLEAACLRLHDELLSACAGHHLYRAVVRLHEPVVDRGEPVCHGCDRGTLAGPDAVWPCRTYHLLVRDLLGVADVEGMLTRMQQG